MISSKTQTVTSAIQLLPPLEGPLEQPELQKGDTGESVSDLQLLLNKRYAYLGLEGMVLDPEKNELVDATRRTPEQSLVTVDGVFGPQTACAVQFMQCIGGLETAGIVDEETWNFLCKGVASMPLLRLGDKGTHVRQMQQTLELLKYDVDVDSFFDHKTRSAVSEFQKQSQLIGDGVVDVDTWEKIIEYRMKHQPCIMYFPA